ncbi:MAG: hypothetical protein ACPG9A_05080, partial [Paracoccaceae bacterium]
HPPPKAVVLPFHAFILLKELSVLFAAIDVTLCNKFQSKVTVCNKRNEKLTIGCCKPNLDG